MATTRRPLRFAAHFLPGEDDEMRGEPHALLVDVTDYARPFEFWFYTPLDLAATIKSEAQWGRFPAALASDVAFAGETAWRQYHRSRTGCGADSAGADGATDRAGSPGRFAEIRLPLDDFHGAPRFTSLGGMLAALAGAYAVLAAVAWLVTRVLP